MRGQSGTLGNGIRECDSWSEIVENGVLSQGGSETNGEGALTRKTGLTAAHGAKAPPELTCSGATYGV